MPTPILATKLYIPPARPELVPRPGLIERLNEGPRSGRKLTLISAPAGFGKTTLVSSWIDSLLAEASSQQKIANRVAWLSLDESDSELSRFLTYFVAALGKIEAGLGEQVLTALKPPLPPLEVLLTALINEMTEVSSPFVLVLDDYHVIEEPAIDQALAFLLDHLPSHMHLVITSRSDPSLPLSGLRARGQLTELRTADLRFTASEVSTFLSRVTDLDFSAEDVAALEARTEGWIAGLQLAALSLQSASSGTNPVDTSSFIAAFSGSDRYVIDYLADEVLKQRSPGTTDFLLQTSILDRLCGPLCEAVTGEGNGQETLERLETANLFLVPLDNERHWYRYHHLFADLLRQRLARQQPSIVANLHQRASKWYANQAASSHELEFASQAVHHALAAADVEQATTLVEIYGGPALMRGEVTLLMAWLDKLPAEVIERRPRLCMGQAWIRYFTQRPQELEQWLQRVESLIQADIIEDPAIVAAYQGEVSNLRAWVARNRGDLVRAIPLFEQSLSLLPAADYSTRGLANLFLGNALSDVGQMTDGMQRYREGIALCKKAGNISAAMGGTAFLAELYTKIGQLHRAKNILQEGLQWAEQEGLRHLSSIAELYVQLAAIAYEQNELELTEGYLSQATDLLAEGLTASGLFVLSQQLLAQLKLAQGEIEQAQQTLDKVEQIIQRWQTGNQSADFAARQVRLWLRTPEPNWPAILRWQQQAGLPTHETPTFAQELQQITVARVLLARSKAEQVDTLQTEAIDLLETLHQRAEAAGRWGRVIEICTLKAMAWLYRGETESALSALERALLLAAPEQYVRIFVDFGWPVATLLRQAHTHGLAPTYVPHLLTAFEAEEDGHSPVPQHPGPPALIEPLSERELDVLRLLPTELTTPEIAEELMVATSTVRSHVKSIYGKLEAHSRYEAVERARQLKLL